MQTIICENDLSKIISLIRDIAAKQITARFFSRNDLDVRIKTSEIDVVTEADEAAENDIHKALTKLFPRALIIGEEACERDASLLTRLANAPFAILVDPLDGTLNFAQGLPLFGCMISVLEYGVTVAGIIFDPVSDVAHAAIKGRGAWKYKNEMVPRQLKISSNKQVSEMTIGLSWGHFPANLKSVVTKNLATFSSGFHFRTAAQEYKLMCEGHVDILCYYRIKPWDHAAGALLVEEAGGVAANFEGAQYSPLFQKGGILVAQSKECWHRAYKVLFA